MMEKKVLIIYHSEYGYVKQIANFIKDRPQKKGLEVITVDVIRNQNTEVYPPLNSTVVLFSASIKGCGD